MKKNRIVYLLFLFAGVYLLVLYDEYVSLVVFSLLLLIPIFACICFPFWKRQIRVKTSISDPIIKMGEECKFIIQLMNESVFPVTNGTIRIKYRNQLDDTFQERKIRFQLDGKSSQKLMATFYGSHCGMLEFMCDSVCAYDYFGLFSAVLYGRKNKEKNAEVMVVPEFEYADDETDEQTEQKEDITVDLYGESSTEIKGVREYRQGDALKHIHWKLSSKQKQLMVKEYSQEESEREMFIFAFLYEDKEEVSYDWYDEKMDELVNTSMSMLVEQRPHEVVWYHPKGKYFETTKIDFVEDIGFLVEKIIRAGIGQKMEDYEIILKDYLL